MKLFWFVGFTLSFGISGVSAQVQPPSARPSAEFRPPHELRSVFTDHLGIHFSSLVIRSTFRHINKLSWEYRRHGDDWRQLNSENAVLGAENRQRVRQFFLSGTGIIMDDISRRFRSQTPWGTDPSSPFYREMEGNLRARLLRLTATEYFFIDQAKMAWLGKSDADGFYLIGNWAAGPVSVAERIGSHLELNLFTRPPCGEVVRKLGGP